MKKTILTILMIIVFCTLTVAGVYAHAVTADSGPCDCNAPTFTACDGNAVRDASYDCSGDCRAVISVYNDVAVCTSCGHYWTIGSHEHGYHTGCGDVIKCKYSTAVTSIDSLE